MPPQPPLRVAVVARMVRSKGVDLAVEAVRQARAGGADVQLSLCGAPDAENPRVHHGRNLAGLVGGAGHHLAGPDRRRPRQSGATIMWCCVPSRGGEGLPRSLLEGAAAGRAVRDDPHARLRHVRA